MTSRISDFPDVTPADVELAPEARRRRDFTLAVVEAATSRTVSGAWHSAVACMGHVGRKKCRATVEVERRDDTVHWRCQACGEFGVVSGFAGTEADMTGYARRGKRVLWGFDDQERAVLVEATTAIPELRAIIARARREPHVEGVFLVDATVAELDDIYTLVEQLTDCTRSQRRIDLLDGLRASLCTSMDGF